MASVTGPLHPCSFKPFRQARTPYTSNAISSLVFAISSSWCFFRALISSSCFFCRSTQRTIFEKLVAMAITAPMTTGCNASGKTEKRQKRKLAFSPSVLSFHTARGNVSFVPQVSCGKSLYSSQTMFAGPDPAQMPQSFETHIKSGLWPWRQASR